jgi:DNA helicase HerA-like ATPase
MVVPRDERLATPEQPPSPLLVAKAKLDAAWADMLLLPGMSNRHGLIAGATGTGKTVTLQVIAEQFSRQGVPVFLADVKGDLTGLSQPGDPANTKIADRLKLLELENFARTGCPVQLFDVFGEQGHPMRATISDMGPMLLARLLGLNDTQAGVLTLTFRVADDNGLLLLDLKDLRAMVQFVGDNARDLKTKYGNVSAASVGAIQRALLGLEEQGAEKLFGEPSLDFHDLLGTDELGRGVITILAADKLLHSPQVYASFLLWLLSQLFQNLTEVGDPEKPKLVFFFDEAHLLFNDAPKALVDKIEQVVRLIRSKGVGVFFVTQNPLDLPDTVLGQLGNRVQHALRAFTPRDQKAVRAAAETFRSNPKFNVATAITELGVGEALVSFLDVKGMPCVVDRALVCPPGSRIGPVTDAQRGDLIKRSRLFGKYEIALDRESAYEVLTRRASQAEAEAQKSQTETELQKIETQQAKERAKREAALEKEWARIEKGQAKRQSTRTKPPEDVFSSFAKNAARSLGTNFGRSISRGILGSLMGQGKSKGRK